MLVALSLAVAVALTPATTSAATCDGTWLPQQVPAPPTGLNTDRSLDAIDASSATNAWAVGAYAGGHAFVIRLIDGDWKARRLKGMRRAADVLAVAANDVWVAGWRARPEGGTEATIAHRTGSGWTRQNLPLPSGWSQLWGIDASGRDDIVAVGDKEPGVGLIIRWDGTRWSRLRAPVSFGLYDVVSYGQDDLWVSGQGGKTAHDVWHWDGATWAKVTPFEPPNVYDIASDGSGSIWAVGRDVPFALAQHWNGTSWDQLPPLAIGAYGGFDAAEYDPSVGVLAVGWYADGTDHPVMAQRYTGAWELLSTTDVGNASFDDVAIADGHAWAIGHLDTEPIIQHACFP